MVSRWQAIVKSMDSKKPKRLGQSPKAVSWESKKVRLKLIKASPVRRMAFKLKPKRLRISSNSGKLTHLGPHKPVISEQQVGTTEGAIVMQPLVIVQCWKQLFSLVTSQSRTAKPVTSILGSLRFECGGALYVLISLRETLKVERSFAAYGGSYAPDYS